MVPGGDGNSDEDEEMINTTTTFTLDDVVTATKCSNFNKGLGPDGFDGNMLNSSVELTDNVMLEITDALNDMRIPEYLRVADSRHYIKPQRKVLWASTRSDPSSSGQMSRRSWKRPSWRR